jgi:hypothetical protein
MRIEATATAKRVIPALRQPSSQREGGFFMICHGPEETEAARCADFQIAYNGMIATVTPLTDACREWLEENVEIEPWQRLGRAIAV